MVAHIAHRSSSPPKPARADRASRAAAAREEALHDAGLVSRFNAGDEDAFVEIMTRYRERLCSVAWGVLKNQADAEEIAQDAFIRAHRGLAAFRGDASLATWLHSIALNLARNRYWYFFHRRRHVTFSLDGAYRDGSRATFSDLVATDTAGPVRTATVGEFAELIAKCMERLGAQPRQILTLRNSLNHSYGEIARSLNISVNTVKSRISRARESLRVLLVESCPEFGPEARPADWFDMVQPAGGVEFVRVGPAV